MEFYLVAVFTILHPESREPIVFIGDVLDVERIQSLKDTYGVDLIEGVFCHSAASADMMRETILSAGF